MIGIGILFRATGEADVARDPLKRQWPPGLSVSSAPKPSEDIDDSSRRSDPPALPPAAGSSDPVPFSLRQLPAGITVQRAGVSAASPDSVRLDDEDEVEMEDEDEEEYDDDDLVNEAEGEEDEAVVDGAALEGAEEGEEEELEILDTVTPVRAISHPASAEVPDSASRVLDTMESSPSSPQDSGASAAVYGLSPTALGDRNSNDGIVVSGCAVDAGVVAADVLPGEEKAGEQQLLLPEIPVTGQLVETTEDEDVMMMDLGKQDITWKKCSYARLLVIIVVYGRPGFLDIV